MFIEHIEIDRPYSYSSEDLKPMRGKVKVTGELGEMKINLSQELVLKIVALISNELAASAKSFAIAVPSACLDALALSAPDDDCL